MMADWFALVDQMLPFHAKIRHWLQLIGCKIGIRNIAAEKICGWLIGIHKKSHERS